MELERGNIVEYKAYNNPGKTEKTYTNYGVVLGFDTFQSIFLFADKDGSPRERVYINQIVRTCLAEEIPDVPDGKGLPPDADESYDLVIRRKFFKDLCAVIEEKEDGVSYKNL